MSAKQNHYLIVEDCPSLAAALAAMLSQRGATVQCAASVERALAILSDARPVLVLLDVMLPDGTAIDLLARMQALRPAPAVVAMSGSATPSQGFELATYGVRAYLQKPIEPDALDRAIATALEDPPNLTPLLRASVGRRSLESIESEVRGTLVDEALAHANGSRRAAAGLLAVSRQMLQHVLRK